MVRLTKIYTRTGDKGQTSLGDGQRICKSDSLIQAIGDVDEANSLIGLASVYVRKCVKPDLRRIQNDLFDLGADLCLPASDRKTIVIQEKQVLWLEKKIDELNESLGALESFVLPGGSKASSHLHVARSVVRRAERSTIFASKTISVNAFVISYLNRLSDYLFVCARFENKQGAEDILWHPGGDL